MSVMVGVGKGAKSGVLIKNAAALEEMNAIDVLVIDKTGTVTEGKPSVEKVISVKPDYTENDILQKIVALNRSEEHTSELQSLMHISYAVFCLKKKNKKKTQSNNTL